MGGERTRFKKGDGRARRTKGALNRKTVIKKQVGLTSWQNLADYILNEGAEKLIAEMQAMKPKDFAISFIALLEFVKPRLSRQDVDARIKSDINFNITKTYLIPEDKK